MALMNLTIIPLGSGSTSMGEYVAAIQKTLEEADFPYKLTDMGTIIEGSTKDLLALAAQLTEIPFNRGVHRVVTQISLDDRRDKKVALGNKTTSVEGLLNQMNR